MLNLHNSKTSNSFDFSAFLAFLRFMYIISTVQRTKVVNVPMLMKMMQIE